MLTIENISNIKWFDENKTGIECNIKFKEFANEMINYTIFRNDTSPHAIELFRQIDAGEFDSMIAVEPIFNDEQLQTYLEKFKITV